MNKTQLRAWWRQRPPREQALLLVCAALVLAALLWSLALAPALKTLRQHPAQRAQLQATLAQMQALQAQAQSLQGQAKPTEAQAQQALQNQTASLLGPQAALALHGGSATVTLRGASPQALGRWLAGVRTEAHAQVLQARLQHNAEGWSGSVQLGLPQ